MSYLKPQSPIKSGSDYIYPITTADQIMKSDGSRLEGGGAISVDNASKLENNTLAQLMLKIYPVGAIYISTVSTSPNTLFGGTWEALEGRFLLGANASHGAGTIGGEETHTLTINEMPAHQHTDILIADNKLTAWSDTGSGGAFTMDTLFSGTTAHCNNSFSTAFAGSSYAHNNMPPYLSVYMWKRTA